MRVSVHESQPQPAVGSPEAAFAVTLKPGTPMADVGAAVRAANSRVRLVEIGTADIQRLCKWLGSVEANKKFNNVMRYVTHESSRYCPGDDPRSAVANIPNWNWRNPFTAYNCTWGFATPADYPEPAALLATGKQASLAICGAAGSG